MIFIITFVIYPGVTCATNLKFLENLDPGIKGSWNYLLLVFVFNLGDTGSRFVAGQPWANLSDKAVLILTYGRALFIATSLLIAWDVPPSWLFGVNADWFKLINMFLFAFTNGYCST